MVRTPVKARVVWLTTIVWKPRAGLCRTIAVTWRQEFRRHPPAKRRFAKVANST